VVFVTFNSSLIIARLVVKEIVDL